ncbi:MAG TPA: glycoside hydrolase family 38 C-terminal domain-containing protein, partial [Tepidisphaeraceae bacterium]|nr:glycoside hydrolase family 38 C-terminal domain-containing protein [Tepidisphaeraceae bacterium]
MSIRARTQAIVVILTGIFSASLLSAADQPVDLSKPTVYEVGYAHLDTQWRWTYPQVIREFLRHTMEDNFPLFDKYPDYIFNFTGARRYELMKEYYPADFERLRQYVKAGRWYPDGSSVDECDNDIPSAESLIRQILYGNEFFRQEFGIAPHDFMLPDSFGFTGALPEILAHCGIKGFSTQKLTWGSAVGIPFKVGVWIGPDGRSVLAALDPGAYNSEVRGDVSRNIEELARILQIGHSSGVYADFRYYGTGDVGGAPKESSVARIEQSVHGSGPIHVVSARSDQLFDDLTPQQAAKLPKYKGEFLLTWHSTGSISSQSAMKRWNRKNELLADAAERASVAANWLGTADYPAQRLHDAWFIVLGSQMHDMMAGTARADAYDYIWNDELLAMNQFGAIARNAVSAVAGELDTRGQGIPLVVYNPLAIARQDVVEANVDFGSQPVPAEVSVVAPDMTVAPAQILGVSGSVLHILFLARMPSVGFGVFDVQPAAAPAGYPAECISSASNSIENANFKVTVNGDGDIESIFDKRNNREVFAKPARLAFQHEKPIQYPAWNMDWEDQRLPPYAYVDGPATVKVIEQGAVRATLEVTRTSQGSKFVQRISLAAGDAGNRIDVSNVIDWQTQGCALKATFPLTVSNPIASYDSQVGVIQRGNNNPKKYEVPQHQWFDLAAPDSSYGVAVLNDCKYGSDKPADNLMRLTLLYTPGVRANYQDQATQDIGRNEMLYSIVPHAGDWQSADIPSQAASINQPMMVFQAAPHPGLFKSLSLLTVSTPQVAVTAIKKAEASDEIIVRLRELDGRPAGGVRIGAAVPIASAREVDGQEQPLGPAMLTDDGRLIVNLHPFDLRAFALRFSKAPPAPATVNQQTIPLPCDLAAAAPMDHPGDGSFDDDGRTYPAEEFPKQLTLDGIHFQLGERQNALVCRGQSIALPDGTFDRVYLLASAIDGDQTAQFNSTNLTIEDWGSPIGSWDRRLWQGAIEERAFKWNAQWVGLVPGFVKPAEVAWYSNHRLHPTDGVEYYHYCYLFKYRFDIPPGINRTVRLPDNHDVRLFAMTAASGGYDDLAPAHPISDTLDGRKPEAPTISPDGGSFSDTTEVTIQHPLYWSTDTLHVSVNGQPISYSGPIELTGPATVTAELNGNTATAHFDVHDTTPPRIVQATAIQGMPTVTVRFSKRVTPASADAAANYHFDPPLDIAAVSLSPDGRTALLSLKNSIEPAVQWSVSASGIVSISGNEITSDTIALDVAKPVFSQSGSTTQPTESEISGLPCNGADIWSINLFCRPSAPVPDRTLIAGFGRADAMADGQGRYLSVFPKGVHFWSNNADVDGTARLSIGQWQMLTITYDGQTIRLYKNGRPAGSGDVRLQDDESAV